MTADGQSWLGENAAELTRSVPLSEVPEGALLRPIADQPAPVPNGGASMHDLVAADMESLWAEAEGVATVRADLVDRKQVGLDRYGTLLQAGNGRNPLIDAYQESLDLIVYLRQALTEAGWRGHDRELDPGVSPVLLSSYVSATRTAVRVRRLIETDRPALVPEKARR